MIIDWANFTPWSALAGGALIGLSAAIFVMFNGRVAGISGILASVFSPKGAQERLLFLGGLLIAPLLWLLVAERPEMNFSSNGLLVIAAGLLVGFGSRMGAGCTSGHGVCGLSRLSVRSLVATMSFMAAGFITVYVLRHMVGAV